MNWSEFLLWETQRLVLSCIAVASELVWWGLERGRDLWRRKVEEFLDCALDLWGCMWLSRFASWKTPGGVPRCLVSSALICTVHGGNVSICFEFAPRSLLGGLVCRCRLGSISLVFFRPRKVIGIGPVGALKLTSIYLWPSSVCNVYYRVSPDERRFVKKLKRRI